MSDEEMRVGIAKACGWRKDGFGDWIKPPETRLYRCSTTSDCDVRYYPPDYLNDLNAMHEAEKLLLKQRRASGYWTQLYSICTRDGNPGWHATSAQRAEAFCRTLFPEGFK